MKRTIKLTGHDQRNYAHDCIEKAMAEGKVHRVTIEPENEKRKSVQNRLMHRWNGQIHEQRYKINEMPLDTQGQIRAFNKVKFGVPIMFEVPEFEKSWRLTTGHLNYESILEIVEHLDIPVTRLMKVGQFARLLSDMQIFWSRKGFELTSSDDEYDKAMGRIKTTNEVRK